MCPFFMFISMYVTYNVTKCVQSNGGRQGLDNVLELFSLEVKINKVRPLFPRPPCNYVMYMILLAIKP